MTKQITADIYQLTRQIREFAEQRDWVKHHPPKNLVMALSVEVAELLEHFQWLSGEESRNLNIEQKQQVAYEMSDVLIYLLRMAEQLDIDLPVAVQQKIELNAQKYPL